MKLRKLTVSNYRSFEEDTIEIFDVNFFIGPNGTGKSNLLKALSIMKNLLDGKYKFENYNEIVYQLNTKLNIKFFFKFNLEDDERKKIIELTFSNIKYESVIKTDFCKNIDYVVIFNNKNLEFEETAIENLNGEKLVILTKKYDEQNNMMYAYHQELGYSKTDDTNGLIPLKMEENLQKLFGAQQAYNEILNFNGLTPAVDYIQNIVKNFFLNIKWFEPYRNISFQTAASEEIELNPSGENLVRLLNSIVGEDPQLFVEYTSILLLIFPFIERFSSPLRGTDAIFRFKEKGINRQMDFRNASTGMHQATTLLIGLLSLNSPSIILIEEPEAHIHASIQRMLLNFFKTMSNNINTQFIISTHSTIFTGCDDTCSTILFNKREGTTILKRIYDLKELHLVKNILGHKNTDLFNDNSVVFIEGMSELNAFPILFDALGYDYVQLGIRLINFQGGSKHTKLEQYLIYLKDSDVIPFIVADRDKRFIEKLSDWERQDLIDPNNSFIWEKEFEDCFESKIITEAINRWLKEEGFTHIIDEETIQHNIKSKKSIVHFLKKYLYENSLPELDKPAFAEHLAYVMIENMSKKQIEETQIGKALLKIVQTAKYGKPFVEG